MKSSRKQLKKARRHKRIRATVIGTAARPRVAVFKSNKFIYAQVIDDAAGKTIVGLSDYKSKKTKPAKGKKTERATSIGTELAEMMKAKGIATAVFDRGGFAYHGRVKALAEGLRAGGIKI